MKDNEIVKALRCCAKGIGHDDKCENCKVGEIQDRREYIEVAAANAIEHLTAENAALREKRLWQPVLAGNPERKACYLVTVHHWLDGTPVVREAFWNGVDWLSCERRHEITPRVTHWTPLPKAAEEGEKA